MSEPGMSPLGELFRPRPVVEHSSGPIHSEVLEFPVAATAGGTNNVWWILTYWPSHDIAGVERVHHAVKAAVEGCLLEELSRPALDPEQPQPDPVRLALVSFATETLPEAALRAFALRLRTPGPDERRALSRLRAEGQGVRGLEGNPLDVMRWWDVPIVANPVARELNAAMFLAAERTAWGDDPGSHYQLLRQLMKERTPEATAWLSEEPSWQTLDELERRLVADETGCIRWIPPLVFQALCDICALLVRPGASSLAWASCKVEDAEPAMPPLFRIGDGPSAVHVPIGVELLRWCVMPKQAGESIPPFSQWLRAACGSP